MIADMIRSTESSPDFSEELKKTLTHIIKIAQPEKIILFGSAGTGEPGPESDLDLLIVKDGEYNPLDLSTSIYYDLDDVDVPVDMIIVTPEQFHHLKNEPWSVLYPAVNNGEIVYEHSRATS